MPAVPTHTVASMASSEAAPFRRRDCPPMLAREEAAALPPCHPRAERSEDPRTPGAAPRSDDSCGGLGPRIGALRACPGVTVGGRLLLRIPPRRLRLVGRLVERPHRQRQEIGRAHV